MSVKYKKLRKELANNSIIFKGYPHRRHRKTGRQMSNNKKTLLDKSIDTEHNKMMAGAT